MKTIVSFTGTQDGMTIQQNGAILRILELYLSGRDDPKDVEVHHGDCVGADQEFHDIAHSLGCHTVSHPASKGDGYWGWDSKPHKKRAFCQVDEIKMPRPPLIRNKDMVDICDVLLATPKTKIEIMRSGTWATVRYARKKVKYHIIIWPNGSIIDKIKEK
jgi:hypothetical protein